MIEMTLQTSGHCFPVLFGDFNDVGWPEGMPENRMVVRRDPWNLHVGQRVIVEADGSDREYATVAVPDAFGGEGRRYAFVDFESA